MDPSKVYSSTTPFFITSRQQIFLILLIIFRRNVYAVSTMVLHFPQAEHHTEVHFWDSIYVSSISSQNQFHSSSTAYSAYWFQFCQFFLCIFFVLCQFQLSNKACYYQCSLPFHYSSNSWIPHSWDCKWMLTTEKTHALLPMNKYLGDLMGDILRYKRILVFNILLR